MSYRIELTENFKKEAKRLIKKYASLRTEILELGKELAENPTTGIPLGNDVYKIRLGVASKNKGKAGGARVITFVKIIDETETISGNELNDKLFHREIDANGTDFNNFC